MTGDMGNFTIEPHECAPEGEHTHGGEEHHCHPLRPNEDPSRPIHWHEDDSPGEALYLGRPFGEPGQ